MEVKIWSELEKEKRETVADLITEFSTTAVTWNEKEQEQVLQVFQQLMTSFQKEHNLKPHQVVVIAKMFQEAAIADLYEWLPEDFEEWENKDELMALFFFGQKGLDRYQEEKKKLSS